MDILNCLLGPCSVYTFSVLVFRFKFRNLLKLRALLNLGTFEIKWQVFFYTPDWVEVFVELQNLCVWFKSTNAHVLRESLARSAKNMSP